MSQVFRYKPTHRIRLVGCDDVTDIDIALDPAEVNLLEELAELSVELGGGCNPIMTIKEL